jgi:hypothetical protein
MPKRHNESEPEPKPKPEPEGELDPIEAACRREPMDGAGVRVIVLAGADREAAERVARSVEKLVAARERKAESVVVPVAECDGLHHALARGLENAKLPLVVVTTADAAWTAAHLGPLLKGIDKSDHVFGCRAAAFWERVRRWLSALRWRFLFAVPFVDVHSPFRMHRLEKLAAIPLQSASGFVDIEILAKATFLGHVLDEVPVPRLETLAPNFSWRDFVTVFNRPNFKRLSRPAEDSQGEQKGEDRPGGEDPQGGSHGEEIRPAQDDHPQGTDELREGQGLDEGLHRAGEILGFEEHAGEQPHRQHDEVHEPAHGLGGLGPAGHEQADAAERERTGDIDQDHKREVAADRHAEAEDAKGEQGEQIGHEKREPGAQEGQ